MNAFALVEASDDLLRGVGKITSIALEARDDTHLCGEQDLWETGGFTQTLSVVRANIS